MRQLAIRLFVLAALLLCLNARSFAASGTATLIGTDTTTQGNWMPTYGTVGYYIPNGPSVTPSDGSSFSPGGASLFTWGTNVSSATALKTGSGSTNIASCWYNNFGTSTVSLNLDVNVTSGTQTVALYLLDYDQQGRAESIQVADDSNASIGLPIAVSGTNFANGEYLIWSISGEVHIKITLVSGPNAVASGIFFGENSSMPPPATSGAYLFQATNKTLASMGTAQLTFTLPAGTYILQITGSAVSGSLAGAGTLNSIYLTPQPANPSGPPVPLTTPDSDWSTVASAGGLVYFPSYAATVTVNPASTTQYEIDLFNSASVSLLYSFRVLATPVSGLSAQSFSSPTP